MNGPTHEAKRAELRGLQLARIKEGWAALPWQRTGNAFETTGVATWCSALSAKPFECRTDVRAGAFPDRVPHSKTPSGRAGHPLRSVHGGEVEFVHNYKVAGTALRRYFACEYGEDADTNFRLSVFAVRDPIDRFVAAVGELLQRCAPPPARTPPTRAPSPQVDASAPRVR